MLARVIVAIVLLVLPTAGFAQAEKRIALLIGNQVYSAEVGPLKNVHNDIALIGAALRSLSFDVTEVKDADYRGIETAISRHIQAVRRGGEGTVSLVYYAGHGAANPDTKINYLIPVDVASADDEELWTLSVNLNRIVETLREQAPRATHYVVFDACRNELNLTRKGKRALADRGFVPIAYTPGVMIAYATAPGRTATDAGVYAKALASEIVKPGIEAVTMFRRVALRVNREIGQDPWMAASTLPEVYLAGGVAPTDAAVSATVSEAADAWSAVKETNSIAVLEAFVARHGDTFYGEVARAHIEELKNPRVAVAPGPDHLFTVKDRGEVRALANKHGFILPPFEFALANRQLPDKYRKFIGVWVDETGNGGKGRRNMMILTSADASGRLQGFQLYGPPDETSFDPKFPASSNVINAVIEGNRFRYSDASGAASFQVQLFENNAMQYSLATKKGQTTTRSFRLVWSLMDAERKAAR